MVMERREMPRYVARGNVAGLLPGEGAHEEEGPTLRGQVVNLSNGGACVTVDRFIEPLKVLPLRFGFPDLPVLLPVLAQVRWVEPSLEAADVFRVGLQFIA
jgi:hypothetical protein